MTWLRCVLLVLLVAACAPGAEEKTGAPAAPAEQLVWPEPPLQARVKFLYAFRQPQDLGVEVPLLKRVWEFVVGKEARRMVRPYGIAAEGSLIAVADPGGHVFHVFDTEKKTYKRIGKAGDEALISPVGIAIGKDRIYVADSFLGKILTFTPDGELVATIANLERPTGLAYDPKSNRLFVAETTAHRISVFDGAGKHLFSFGERGTGKAEFNYPTHVFVAGNTLYVNDTMNFRLLAFDLDGKPTAAFGHHGDGSGDFAQPKGVAVDGQGHIYVADAVFNRVQIFDRQGRFLLAFGREGAKDGQFLLPSGVFITGDRIYVADSYNQRVQVFQFLGGS